MGIPSNLLNNSVGQGSSLNYNLLIGTASADTTARLWYLNAMSQSLGGLGIASQQLSPMQQNSSSCFGSEQMMATSFCIQEYCGHTGKLGFIKLYRYRILNGLNFCF